MRIATSTIYSQQTAAIDNQQALYEQLGQQLSSGIKLNEPSDDPSQIAQDLGLRTTVASEGQQSTNVTDATSELTTTDNALSNLTSLIQSARQIAVQGSSDVLSSAQRGDLGDQLSEIFKQALAVANTQYNGRYVFGGSAANANPPVTATGNAANPVVFTGNEQQQGELIYNGQQFALSTTFQSAFNYKASDGSPNVFQMLQNLQDTITNQTPGITSTSPINAEGKVVYGPVSGNSPAATTLGNGTSTSFAVTPVPDSAGYYTIQINATVNGQQDLKSLTFPPGAAIDDGTAGSVVGAINALGIGVTASYNAASQTFSISDPNGPFDLTDEPTPANAPLVGGGTSTNATAATNTGNLTSILNVNTGVAQVDSIQNVSAQLTQIDNVLNTTLNARSVIGARIQALGNISNQLQTDTTDNKNIQSGIEDVDVAQATSQFTATETALQAAYATTTRLESMTLMNYLSTGTTG